MKSKQKVGGKNEFHMKYVQLARRSNESGFHDPDKKQKNKKDRKEAREYCKGVNKY